MGTTYKLKPEIIQLILERKKKNPALSCRHFTLTFKKEFNVRLSKSSVNAIFKDAGLSLPSGRRGLKKKALTPKLKPPQISIAPKELLEITSEPVAELREIPAPQTQSTELPGKETGEALLRAINFLFGNSNISGICRTIKILLADGTTRYLDGLNYTIWNTNVIPYDFGAPVFEVTRRLNLDSANDISWVFFMAPEGAISDDFIALISALKKNTVDKISLYGDTNIELMNLKPSQNKQIDLVFALWPWQLKECRLIRHIASFLPYLFSPTGFEYFAAEAEVEIKSKKAAGEGQVFYGYALKPSLDSKTELIVLSTYDKNKVTAQKVLGAYLEHWPNLKNTAHDFDEKLELFSFTSGAQQLFSPGATVGDEVLDAYLRWYIFPRAYRKVDFATMQERFYGIDSERLENNNYLLIKFKPVPGFAYLDDLAYACQRLNERLVVTPDNKKIWFSVK